MFYFWSILLLLLIIYFGLIIMFSFSWRKLKPFILDKVSIKSNIYVSAIVALRNEERNINQLIQALDQQTLSSSLFEVIIVNDHSTDNTFTELQKLSSKYTWLHIYQLPENKSGKKEALKLGISKAKGELLAFTDGDCIPGSNWLSTLSEFFYTQNKPDFIIGMVDIIANTWIQKIFRLDFLSLVLSSAGAANLGHPILCNGANLGVKSSAIKKYMHNTSIASGDDVFLLHHIKKNGGRIKILKSYQHLIFTKAPNSISNFLEQRIRWASKTKYYKDKDTLIVALLVFMVNFALTISVYLSFSFQSFTQVLIAFGIKLFADLYIFLQGKDLYRYKGFLWWLPLITIIYPFYITGTILLSIKKPFAWKGRKYLK